MRFAKVTAPIAFCLCLMSVSFAERNIEPNGKIKVLPSASFVAENVQVVYINLVPHLQYSLTNTSDSIVPGLTVTFVAYDAKGNMCGHQR